MGCEVVPNKLIEERLVREALDQERSLADVLEALVGILHLHDLWLTYLQHAC